MGPAKVMQSRQLSITLTSLLVLYFCVANPACAIQADATGANSKCTLTPELVEGPYYINDTLFRSNITEDQPGLPLNLAVKVVDTSCNPLVDVFVDIWSCNSTGFYSGYTHSPIGPGPGPHSHPHHGHHHPNGSHPWHHPNVTDDLVWLRGIAQTNEQGIADFATLVPGWYPGRTAHIHLKVHVPYHTYTNETQEYTDSHVVHTGQMFFEETFYKQITGLEPYILDKHRRVHNDEDHDFQQDPTAVLEIAYKGDSLEKGVIGSITTVVDPSATPTPKPMMDPPQFEHGTHRDHGASGHGPGKKGKGHRVHRAKYLDILRQYLASWRAALFQH